MYILVGALGLFLAVAPYLVAILGGTLASRQSNDESILRVTRASSFIAVTCGVLIGIWAGYGLIKNFGNDNGVFYVMCMCATAYPITRLQSAVHDRMRAKANGELIPPDIGVVPKAHQCRRDGCLI